MKLYTSKYSKSRIFETFLVFKDFFPNILWQWTRGVPIRNSGMTGNTPQAYDWRPINIKKLCSLILHELILHFTCLSSTLIYFTLSTGLEFLNKVSKLVNKYNKDISKIFTSEILTVDQLSKRKYVKPYFNKLSCSSFNGKNGNFNGLYTTLYNTTLLLFLTLPLYMQSLNKLKMIYG